MATLTQTFCRTTVRFSQITPFLRNPSFTQAQKRCIKIHASSPASLNFKSFGRLCKISGVFAGLCGGALSFNFVTQQLSNSTIYADDGASKHKVSKRVCSFQGSKLPMIMPTFNQ